MRVSVVIPTYNEAQSIGRVLDDIPWALVNEVLVVDSDSSDGTRDIAEARGALTGAVDVLTGSLGRGPAAKRITRAAGAGRRAQNSCSWLIQHRGSGPRTCAAG